MQYGITNNAQTMRYGAMYDGQQLNNNLQKGHLLHGQRRRMNWLPMCICLFVPWAFFCACMLAMVYLRYNEPVLAYFIIAFCLALVVFAGYLALKAWRAKKRGFSREPSWVIFFFLSLLTAVVMGFSFGNIVYSSTMSSYYALSGLNTYSDLDPSRTLGEQVLDAGVITFVDEASVNTSFASGFSNGNLYCVAPITTSNSLTYDFWAVGTNCCNAAGTDYYCGDFNDDDAHTGTRLMDDSARAYYRMAVQEAEAQYGINAPYPLFFTWSAEDDDSDYDDDSGSSSSSSISSLSSEAGAYCMYGAFFDLLLQLFLVICAAIVFSRLGSL
eukprot:NODE_9969_length_1386_cov_3.945195.p1 GENE.NODE_9969_length_1386_cov_3.945195~~NODE_9969_length_1386_cov_3.945195.p1  ORF type:complete len:328 (-),score=100.70 NODE_9969_length_1386_cov_3.945195:311-1294(-)